MVERLIFLMVTFLSDWLKNQDAKVVILIVVWLLTAGFFVHQNHALTTKVHDLYAQIEVLRAEISACEANRAALEVEVRHLKRIIEEGKK